MSLKHIWGLHNSKPFGGTIGKLVAARKVESKDDIVRLAERVVQWAALTEYAAIVCMLLGAFWHPIWWIVAFFSFMASMHFHTQAPIIGNSLSLFEIGELLEKMQKEADK